MAKQGGNPFWRHVVALFAGSGASQAIALLAVPFLTKLYGPEQYGTFAAFISMALIVGIISSGRYDMAILLPEEDRDGASLVALSLGLTAVSAALAGWAVSVWPVQICTMLNNMDLLAWLPFLPLAIFLCGANQVLEGWANRKARYKRMSAGRLLVVLLTVAIQLSLGAKGVDGGLMIGSLVGQTTCVAVLTALTLFHDDIATLVRKGLPRLPEMAKTYKSHPAFLVPSHGAGVVYSQLPVLFISAMFGKAAAGWYGLAMRMVTLPTLTLANSVGSVYRQHAAEAYRKTGEFLALFKKTLSSTAVLSIVPFLCLVMFIDDVVVWILGERWKEAGELAQILGILGWVGFFSTPVDKGAIIVGKMGYIICWHALRLLCLMVAFHYCSLSDPGLGKMVATLSAVGIIFYLVDVYFEYVFAKGDR